MTAKKPKILCVDDESTNLELLEILLEPRGYEVIKAENAQEALKQIEQQTIDLVVLDVMMPEINGFELCKKLKGSERYRDTPVIMITGSTAKEDRIRGIEAGAQDFISKPIDSSELFARIGMLLKIKVLHDRLTSAYNDITNMVSFGKTMALSFDPLTFDFLTRIDEMVKHILRNELHLTDRPEVVIVGFSDESGLWQWYRFDAVSEFFHRTCVEKDLGYTLPIPREKKSWIFYMNEGEREDIAYQPFIEQITSFSTRPVLNMVGVLTEKFRIAAINYGKIVSQYDAEVLSSIVMQSLYMRSLASQVKETENVFDYLVFALARAAEANDEDTGNHILRVGEYCVVVAGELGLSEKFLNIIRTQATLHDVGKLHIHPDLLKKPQALTPEEWGKMKTHTLFGAKILGNHVRLTLAKNAALSHHERWDGSGYPYGLKGEQIPIEGRILTIADQYDALRNARVYKPSFDHQKTCNIILEGDGRTMPHHFDPHVLRAFKEKASLLEEIYERLKG